MNLFTEISLIIILVIIISILIRLLKQPLIVGYILAGILAGPLFMKVITVNDAFTTFSQVGVALLLFIVGLGLNPKLIREVGPVAAIAGFGQVLITGALGFGLMHWVLNFPTTLSIYLTLALTFSSTIVVIKLLSDKNTLETLYGRMAIGILLIQDLVAVVALMFISSAWGGVNLSFSSYTLALLGKGLISMIALIIFGYFILPKMGSFIARSQEFLLIFSIGWCLALAALFRYLGFSIEIGALLAGVTLSMTPYHHEISSKVKPLRDFFLVLFFIILGSQMEFSNLQNLTIPIIAIASFVLIIKPLIIMVLIGLLGYTKRNSFITGLSLAQVSEFSFILIALGTNVGQIDKSAISFITIVGLISLATSSYFILYAEKIYNLLSPLLGFLERKGKKVDEYKLQQGEKKYDVVLFGQNRVGYDILESIKRQKKSILVIDFNPNTIVELTKKNIDCRYGDAGDIELLNQINFKRVKMVISTIPDPDTNLLLITRAKQINHNLIIIVIAHQIDDALKFYEEGASYVLMPHFVGGNYMATLLQEYEFDMKKFLNERIKHQAYLKKRKQMGHEHPKAERDR